MIRILAAALFLSFLNLAATSQNKTQLSLDDFNVWNRIEKETISQNGSIVSYQIAPGKGDQTLFVMTHNGTSLLNYQRGVDAVMSWSSDYVVFKIKPAEDTIRALKRKKTKKEKMPGDSLGIFSISSTTIEKVASLIDFKLPEEWSGFLAYRIEDLSKMENDTTKSMSKKTGEENGYPLILQDLESNKKDTLHFVKDYYFAKKGKAFVYETSGKDSTDYAGINYIDLEDNRTYNLISGDFSYKQLAVSEDGTQVAFLTDTVTDKSLIRNFILSYWKKGMPSSQFEIDSTTLQENWIVSEHGKVRFSENGKRLYFGTSPVPVVQDTSLLEDEIIQVEIWNYQDKRLQPEQEKNKEEDKKKNYLAVYYPETEKYFQLGNESIPEVEFATEKENGRYALGINDIPYYREVSWEGFPPFMDLYLIDVTNGNSQIIEEKVRSYGGLSPDNKFAYWYDLEDTTWYAYDINKKKRLNLSESIPTSVADELDDHPDYPRPYGLAGWTYNDRHILIYDRFDIWKVDPASPEKAENLTNGRNESIRYRYVDLDKEDPFIDLKNSFLHFFNEKSKQEGYARLLKNYAEVLVYGNASFDNLTKAKNSDNLFFTMENNQVFPDIIASDLSFERQSKISDANPQQKEKLWSTNEIMSWTSLNGDPLEGILYKPENFDPGKKYPMIVYFYERNSDNLHRYWGAYPHRSIINPNFYASRGYIVFIPDIIYRDGYPGPSCYDAVMPGVTKLVDSGFIDKENIGVQGHSWGGYQSAYLVTQTDIFACAESGAPVVNMYSAYGGIRWRTGLSRMFQYEHSQSRIGGTIWEYPMRYYENSPLFFVDKINTPILIMHNDKDGAVPWYQGIEFFVALRRLDKPAWMLNYNDEPHWPTRRENIIDFQTRMLQFFDHYLMEKPMPEWMNKGIPAIEKGINKGY